MDAKMFQYILNIFSRYFRNCHLIKLKTDILSLININTIKIKDCYKYNNKTKKYKKWGMQYPESLECHKIGY